MFGLFENTGKSTPGIMEKQPGWFGGYKFTPLSLLRPSERRILKAGNWTDPQGRNIPDPWRKREWEKTRDIANLPAVIGNIGVSGPTKSMYGSRVPLINPELFKTARPRPSRGEFEYQSQKTLHESGVVAMDMKSRGIASSNPRQRYRSREERLSQGGPSEVHAVALDSTRKHRGRGTDVLSDSPYPRDMPLSGQQNSDQFPILRSIARRLGV